jgi:hypothetical protein
MKTITVALLASVLAAPALAQQPDPYYRPGPGSYYRPAPPSYGPNVGYRDGDLGPGGVRWWRGSWVRPGEGPCWKNVRRATYDVWKWVCW